jgi:hypothetical protein
MMRRIVTFVSLYIILLCGVALYMSDADAGENGFIQIDELSVNYKHYHEGSRHPLFTDSQLKEGVDLTMNTDLLLRTFFWDNLVHSNTDDAQYRHIGWQFKFGTHVTSFLNIQYEHHSQHLLDTSYPYMKFPVEDSLGFTLYIYGARPRGAPLLGF